MTTPSTTQYQKSLVWFRRDLRDYDHAALYHALKTSEQVYCVFVFDTDILDALPHNQDLRVEFIHASIEELKHALYAQGGDLIVLHGKPLHEIPGLAQDLHAEAVFSNRDYEPSAVARDTAVQKALAQHHIDFLQFKDQVIFEHDEILTKGGKPFSVYTPYKNAVHRTLNDFYLKPYPVGKYSKRLARSSASAMPTLEDIGFARTNLQTLKLPTGMSGGKQLFEDFLDRMGQYRHARDFPAVKGPSYLSVHLRFGTVSIRQLMRVAREAGGQGAETWVNELIWREFYTHILTHRPEVAEGKTFQPHYNHLDFPGGKALFKAWCEGRTGYPIVDAAMRQINQTGYMHNRLRMVVASFLSKDLLVNWRWGERYFADKLIDYDLSSNNGGWQWASSTGSDAQPWFRIFNPVSQSEKFDAEGKFIRKYVPELAACDNKEIHAPWLMSPERQAEIGVVIGKHYPQPIVDHATQRQHALSLYKSASKQQSHAQAD